MDDMKSFSGERELNESGFCRCEFSFARGWYLARHGVWQDGEPMKVLFSIVDVPYEDMVFPVLINGAEYKAITKEDFDKASR